MEANKKKFLDLINHAISISPEGLLPILTELKETAEANIFLPAGEDWEGSNKMKLFLKVFELFDEEGNKKEENFNRGDLYMAFRAGLSAQANLNKKVTEKSLSILGIIEQKANEQIKDKPVEEYTETDSAFKKIQDKAREALYFIHDKG